MYSMVQTLSRVPYAGVKRMLYNIFGLDHLGDDPAAIRNALLKVRDKCHGTGAPNCSGGSSLEELSSSHPNVNFEKNPKLQTQRKHSRKTKISYICNECCCYKTRTGHGMGVCLSANGLQLVFVAQSSCQER